MRLVAKSVPLLMVIALLSGCEACSPFWEPPPPKPFQSEFQVSVKLSSQNEYSFTVQCEEYYDAQCSTRGNFWAFREIGLDSTLSVRWHRIDDPELGAIEIMMPQCSSIARKNVPPASWIDVKKGSERTPLSETSIEMFLNGKKLI